MPNTIAFLGNRLLPREVTKRFAVTLSGSYTQGVIAGTAGETLNFNGASNANKYSRSKIPNGGASGALPVVANCEVTQISGGFSGQIEKNAVAPTAANYVLRLFQAGSGAAQPAELTAGAYPAALIANPIIVEITIPNKNL